eukprot:m.327886 g.327886  ORF g.327886 m.327886 type:complete len:403 (+) comp16496_c0_seq21:303-1511(+)
MCWSANVQVWRHETARFKSYDRNVRRGHLFWEVLKESQHVRHDSSCQLCQAKPSVVERKMVTTTKSVCTLWALCCSGVCATGLSRGEMLTKMPEEIVLHAPFTPFGPAPGYEVNVSVIPALAAQAASTGVNTVWVAGTMGQFDSMTVAERKAIAEAWVTAAKSQSLYVIVNIGTTVRSEAIELAAHAAQIGADAIASVPPYYTTASDIPSILQFLQPIAGAAPHLPFFYYHIPSATKTEISVSELFRLASGGEYAIPTMAGVKYVDTNMTDWLELVTHYNSSHALLFATEPKLQYFGFGQGRGSVLAEDFFGPTFIRMKAAFDGGDMVTARKEQQWKLDASATFGQFPKTAAERAVYRWLCGVDMGPPRPPRSPMDNNFLPTLQEALINIDFFNKSKLGPHK